MNAPADTTSVAAVASTEGIDVRIGPDELVLWRDGDVIPLRAGHARAIDLRGLVAAPPPPEPALRGP